MRLRNLLFVLPLFSTACAQPAAQVKPKVEPGRYVKTLKIADLERRYLLRIPKKYDNRTKLPLVVVLHGWTSNADQAELYTGFAAKADQEGFILVTPDGTEGIGKSKGWNTGFLNLGAAKVDDVEFIEKLLDESERDLYVDQGRIYVAGHSNGAMMAYALGARLSGRLAAIGVVAGSIGMGSTTVPDPKDPVSAIIIHGQQDETVAYDENSKAMLKSIGAPRSAKFWAEKIGAGKSSAKTEGNLTITTYSGGRHDTEVEFVSIANGTHSWPGGLTRSGPETSTKVSAVDLIWSFFIRHPKK